MYVVDGVKNKIYIILQVCKTKGRGGVGKIHTMS